MKVLEENKYYKVQIFDDILEIKWFPTIAELDEEEYKKQLYKTHAYLLDYDYTKLLENAQDFFYPLTQNLIDWIKENITLGIFNKSKLKKMAYVMPKDVLSKLGVENLVDQARLENPRVIRLYFDDRDKAVNWLNK